MQFPAVKKKPLLAMKADTEMPITTTRSIEYTRTIVPSSMRSPYWKYFGFPSDNANNILTKQRIICTLCNTAIAYNKNTSNLRTHLISRHCDVLHELQRQQQQQQQLYSGHNNSQQPRKRTHSDMAAATDDKLTKDSCYTTFSTGQNDAGAEVDAAYIAADFKENTTHALILEEEQDQNDVVDLIDHQDDQAPVIMSAVDADADYAEYSTALQTEDTDDTSALLPKDLVDEEATLEHEEEDDDEHVDIAETYTYVDNICKQKNNLVKSVNTTASELDNLIVNMLIRDLLPLSIVDGVGFTQLLSQFASMDKTAVELQLNSLYATMQQTVSTHLKSICQAQAYSLSIEFNKSVDNLSVICVYFNYYSVQENELLSILYQSVVMQTSDEDCVDLENLLTGFNITNCAAVVVNESNPFVEVFFQSHDIPIIPCLESVLRRCMLLIFSLHSVSEEFKKVSKLADTSIKAESTMFITLPEVYPQCVWSKLNFLQFVQENLSLNSFDDSAVLEKSRYLVEYICPLKITLETIGDEPLSLCSLMRPFTLKLLEEHFSAYFADDDYLSEVKHILNDELTNSVLKNKFLNESTYFDARFRRDFLNASHVTDIQESVCARFQSLIEFEEATCTKIKEEISHTDSNHGSSNRKSSLKSFFQRNGAKSCAKSTASMQKINIEHEFNKYNCEPSLDLEQCPISWWHEHGYSYKQLKKVADYYLCVPCCVNRLFRCDIVERNELQNKRSMLRNQNSQQIWYLHYNNKFYDKIRQAICR